MFDNALEMKVVASGKDGAFWWRQTLDLLVMARKSGFVIEFEDKCLEAGRHGEERRGTIALGEMYPEWGISESQREMR